MIFISELKTYGDSLVSRITDLKKHVQVIDDSQLGAILKEIPIGLDDNPILVSFIPSIKTTGSNSDMASDNSNMLFMILERADRQESNEDFIEKMNRLQILANTIKKQMLQDTQELCMMKFLNVSIEIDPVWKLHECDGWEINFSIKNSSFH